METKKLKFTEEVTNNNVVRLVNEEIEKYKKLKENVTIYISQKNYDMYIKNNNK